MTHMGFDISQGKVLNRPKSRWQCDGEDKTTNMDGKTHRVIIVIKVYHSWVERLCSTYVGIVLENSQIGRDSNFYLPWP